MTGTNITTLQLGIIWRRLEGLMDEISEAFIRTAFSPIVRENCDFAFALMDAEGRQFAQWNRSIPSFIGAMPVTLAAMLEKFPAQTLRRGDTIISNDPWIGTGHLNDITMIRPIFRGGRVTAYVGSTFHAMDIGGARSPHAREVYAEGLLIPVSMVLRDGEENEHVLDFMRRNMRSAEDTIRDLRAQFGAYDLAEAKLNAILERHGIADLTEVSEVMLSRSASSIAAKIADLPDGSYESELRADGYETPITIKTRITVEGDRMLVDFAGSSEQVPQPINSVLNYTRAYTVYALKCALDPSAPNNQGTFRNIMVTAPEGTVLNPTHPAPVWGRALTGHYLPTAVFNALAQLVPDRVIAQGGANWNIYFRGRHEHGKHFIKNYFMNGGHGARPHMDGPGCLSFPSNIANESIERFENSVPMMIEEKCLVPDTAGAGKFRGGTAQRVSFRSVSSEPLTVTVRVERVRFPPRGLLGGLEGSAGRVTVNGAEVPSKSEQVLKRNDTISFQSPGGGGMFPPAERERKLIAADLIEGLVSDEKSRTTYGNAQEPAGTKGAHA